MFFAAGLAGCAEPHAAAGASSQVADEKLVVRRWKLPKALREVSGLAVDGSGGVYAVADEFAVVYRIDPLSGKILSVYSLGKPTLAEILKALPWLMAGYIW